MHAGGTDGIHPHLHAGIHGVRSDSGTREERPRGWAGPATDWAYGGLQHHGGRGLFRGIHEPGPVVRAGAGELELEEPLGVLVGAAGGRGDGRIRVRELLHKQTPRSPSDDGGGGGGGGGGRKLLRRFWIILEEAAGQAGRRYGMSDVCRMLYRFRNVLYRVSL